LAIFKGKQILLLVIKNKTGILNDRVGNLAAVSVYWFFFAETIYIQLAGAYTFFSRHF
jgi:hypothetical protein